MKDFLDDIGIKIGLWFAAIVGGVVYINMPKNRKRPWWEKISIVILGSLSACYITPGITYYLHVDEDANVCYFFAFVIGLSGLNFAGWIIDILREKTKKLRK